MKSKINKKPKKGTSYAKFSRNRVNFKKTNLKKPTKPKPPKKDEGEFSKLSKDVSQTSFSLDGVWEINPITWKSVYYTPQEWKKREAELNKQTHEPTI